MLSVTSRDCIIYRPGWLLKNVYWIVQLHECVFFTWVTKAQEVMQYYGIELGEQCPIVFKQYCKQTVKDKFVNYWTSEIHNSSKNPIIRYYSSHNTVFCMEQYLIPYLIFVTVPPWRDSEQVLIHLKLSENDIRYQEPLFVTACVQIVTT